MARLLALLPFLLAQGVSCQARHYEPGNEPVPAAFPNRSPIDLLSLSGSLAQECNCEGCKTIAGTAFLLELDVDARCDPGACLYIAVRGGLMVS